MSSESSRQLVPVTDYRQPNYGATANPPSGAGPIQEQEQGRIRESYFVNMNNIGIRELKEDNDIDHGILNAIANYGKRWPLNCHKKFLIFNRTKSDNLELTDADKWLAIYGVSGIADTIYCPLNQATMKMSLRVVNFAQTRNTFLVELDLTENAKQCATIYDAMYHEEDDGATVRIGSVEKVKGSLVVLDGDDRRVFKVSLSDCCCCCCKKTKFKVKRAESMLKGAAEIGLYLGYPVQYSGDRQIDPSNQLFVSIKREVDVRERALLLGLAFVLNFKVGLLGESTLTEAKHYTRRVSKTFCFKTYREDITDTYRQKNTDKGRISGRWKEQEPRTSIPQRIKRTLTSSSLSSLLKTSSAKDELPWKRKDLYSSSWNTPVSDPSPDSPGSWWVQDSFPPPLSPSKHHTIN